MRITTLSDFFTRHLCAALVVLCAFPVACAFATFPTSQPYPGVTYQLLEIKNPLNRIHVLTIELHNPAIHFIVAKGSPEPSTDGYETTLLGPLAIADREHFEIVINGDFFEAKRFKDAKGTTRPFAPGDPVNVRGIAESSGTVWATTQTSRPALIITKDGEARIRRLHTPPADAEEIISGSSIMLKAGKVQPMTSKLETDANPRTAAGITTDGSKLVLLVDDGRWKEHSFGMSTTDLAKVMLDLGCSEAINLDGGGSTEMALRDPATGNLVVVNHPSEGKERPVADVLGVRIDTNEHLPGPVTRPSP